MRLWRSMLPFLRFSDQWLVSQLQVRGADIRFSPDVEFCGYTIPHPSESKMNVRIQTYGVFSLLTSFLFCSFFYQFLIPCDERSCIWGLGPTRLTYFLDTTTAVEALEKGLDSLMDLCDVVTDKFTDARDKFNAEQADKMESWAQFGLDICRLRFVILSVSGSVFGWAFLL